MVAGAGFEPHDLRVMSPMSYQTALPRDITNCLHCVDATNLVGLGVRFARLRSPMSYQTALPRDMQCASLDACL